MQNTLSQGYAFLAYLYAGIVLALIYRVLALLIRLADRRVVTGLADAVFVLVFSAVTYTVIALADDGMIRLYGLCTMAGGAGLARWTLGKPICKRIVKRRT